MELWIRSQDKMKLFRCIDLRIVIEQEYYSIIDNTDDYILGTYNTEERALEVLDDIQRCMTINSSASGDYETLDIKLKELYLQHCILIYNMPKE